MENEERKRHGGGSATPHKSDEKTVNLISYAPETTDVNSYAHRTRTKKRLPLVCSQSRERVYSCHQSSLAEFQILRANALVNVNTHGLAPSLTVVLGLLFSRHRNTGKSFCSVIVFTVFYRWTRACPYPMRREKNDKVCSSLEKGTSVTRNKGSSHLTQTSNRRTRFSAFDACSPYFSVP